ncbi:MAG: rRNA maturation RNase YbeY [Methyloceanibacter sp.]
MSEGDPRRNTAKPRPNPTLVIEVVRHADAWRAITDVLVERAGVAAFAAAGSGRPDPCEITVLLTDDAEMRGLNRTWRGKDKPTNVLAFPAGDETQPGNLGDIALAYETAATKARDENIQLGDHVTHLVVHGVLHLLGFDHMDDAEAEQMEERERQALAALGIPDPYAGEEAARLTEVST